MQIFKRILLIFVILSSIRFFDILFIPVNIIKMLELFAPIVIVIFTLLHIVYDKTQRIKQHFRIEIILILVSVAISTYAAYEIHGQSVQITLIAQRFMYFYFIYFMLHQIKINPDDIMKLIIYFGLVYSFVYLVQYVLYPAEIIGSKMLIDRGTLRIYMPGSGYIVITYFIALTQYFINKEIKYLLLCFVALIIFVLLGTRQLLAAIALLTIFSLILGQQVKSKAGFGILIVIAVIPVFFLFKDIFIAMFELSQSQVGNIESNIRVKAAIFFLFEFFPNQLAYFIGNGVPSSNSSYGMEIANYMESFGFYQSDIGLIGDYTKFGVLFVIGQLVIMIRIIFTRIPEKYMFIKYNFLGIAMVLFMGKGSFGSGDNIVINCLLLYILDTYLFSKRELKDEEGLSINPDIQ